MRRFTVVSALLVVGFLAFRGTFAAFAASPSGTASAEVPMVGTDMKVAPVFDVTGVIISDPTGTILSVDHSGTSSVPLTGSNRKVAPVFDATGAVISDPTGTMSVASQPDDLLVPVTGSDRKVAPVFDATGALVSDPTGTMWSMVGP